MDNKKPKNAIKGKQNFQTIHQPPTKDQIEKFSAAGLSLQQMASLLDMSHDTLERFMNKDPSLRASIEKGRSKSVLNVAATAYNLAVSGDVPAMTMFYLKTRAGWKETHEVQVASTDDTKDQLKAMAEELRRIAKKPNEE